MNVKHYHPAYKIAHEYEHFIYPLAAGSVGLTTVGLYGAIGGVVLGSIDSALINFKIYDKPYLTSTVISWAATYSFELPYKINQVIGIITGLLLTTGTFNDHIDKTIAPAYGALYGNMALGDNYGMAIGLSIGIIDEALSFYNISNQYYLTNMLTYYASTNIYAPKISALSSSIFGINIDFINNPIFKIPLSAVIYKYFDDEDRNESYSRPLVLELNEKLYQSYSKAIEKDQLDDLRFKSSISTIAAQLNSVKINILIAQKQQDMVERFHGLEQNGFDNFFNAFKIFILFIPIVTIENAITSFISYHFAGKFFNLAESHIYKKFMSNETALFLSQNSTNSTIDSNVLLKNINSDISIIINSGNYLISDGLGSGIRGLYSALHFTKIGAADMIIYSQHYNTLCAFLTIFLSAKINENANSLKELQAELSSIDEYTRTHASEMIQNDANNFVYNLREKFNSELKILSATKSIYEVLNTPWQNARFYVDSLFNYLVLANKLANGEVNFNHKFEVLFLGSDISTMMGWESQNIASFSLIYQSILRFDEFNTRIENSILPPNNIVNYLYQKSNESKICFQDLNLARNKASFLYIEGLCLSGRKISITGVSGGGKTSFLKILKGIKHDGIDGYGNITFYTKTGLAPKLIMISQKIYIPPYTSLLELITQKNDQEASTYQNDIQTLEQEIIAISADAGQTFLKLIPRLNENEVWENVLSGGEIQWIGIIRIILFKPDIVLGDEILKGLDSQAITLVKTLFSKYLPETQFIIIDHEAKAHNLDGFYDNNLHFTNQTAILGANLSEDIS